MARIVHIEHLMGDFHISWRLPKILHRIMHREFDFLRTNLQVIGDYALTAGGVERNPRSSLLPNFCERILGSFGGSFHRIPLKYGEPGIDEYRKKGKTLPAQNLRLIFGIILLVGSTFAGFYAFRHTDGKWVWGANF